MRALARERGLAETGTAARIARLVEEGALSHDLARELTQALHYLMTLRLDAQLAAAASGSLVRPAELSTMERDLLRDALPANIELDRAAATLHLSPRTLHRRLAEEGASFRSIKDALRRDLALAQLAKSNDSIARIAADLGYADTSTFYRAFTDWAGMAPSDYRRRLGAGIA